MAEDTLISWADHTFNPWEGCQKVGPGCDNCYAETRNIRYAEKGATTAPNWGPGAPRRRTSAANWRKPLKWDREAAASGKPVFVFCASLADVFDNAVDPQWRRDLFDLIRATPNLTWLLLTKRPGMIVKLFDETGRMGEEKRRWWPRNAAIGCTVVNQEEADRDIPKLLAAKAALNPAFAFLSMEPLLGPVDLTMIRGQFWALTQHMNALNGYGNLSLTGIAPLGQSIDWVIVGGESGSNARPTHPDWARSLRDQCAAADVAFHFKQWGAWHADALLFTDAEGRCPPPNMRVGVNRAGRLLDGVVHDGRPSR